MSDDDAIAPLLAEIDRERNGLIEQEQQPRRFQQRPRADIDLFAMQSVRPSLTAVAANLESMPKKPLGDLSNNTRHRHHAEYKREYSRSSPPSPSQASQAAAQ